MFRMSVARRIIFGVTALTFALCQNSALAGACHAVSPAVAQGVDAPCHELPHARIVVNDRACQTACMLQAAVARPLTSIIAAATDVPALPENFALFTVATHCSLASSQPSDRAQSPPFSRLYCRMLN
jgi:hypothetical protein